MSARRPKRNDEPPKQNPPATTAPKDAVTNRPWRRGVVALLLVTLAVYWRATSGLFTNFDDDFYVTNNPYLRDYSFAGVKAILTSFYSSNYHPLTTLTYFIEFHFFELQPLPYHVTNILLHLLNVLFVYVFVQRLSRKNFTALFVAAIFALHPMHVESVAWVSERKDVLYTFFWLASAIVYLKYRDSGKQHWYFLSLLFFIASLMSKSAAVTLPLVLILIEWYRSNQSIGKVIIKMIPFLLLSLLFGVLNIMAQSAGGSINYLMETYSLADRVFLFLSAPAFYMERALLPWPLCAFHFYPNLQQGWLPWPFYTSILVVPVLALAWFRKGTMNKEWQFGLLFFLAVVSVMLPFKAFGSAFVSERYTYVCYIGLFYPVGQWLTRKYEAEKTRLLSQLVLGGVCAVFATMTYQRIAIWHDGLVLFNDVVEQNPDQYIGYWLRGNMYKLNGDPQQALADYTRALELNNKDEDSYFNRGKILDDLGKPAEAIKDYNRSIALNRSHADVFNNRGWARFETGDTVHSIPDFDTAISLKPEYAEAFNNRGWVRTKCGEWPLAERDFKAAARLKKDYLRPWYNLAYLHNGLGQFNLAVADYDSILQINDQSADAYHFRGVSRINSGDTSGACADWNRALKMGYQGSAELIRKFCK